MALRVVLEVAPKRSFASALDWPGWSRGAGTDAEAVAAMLAYAPRYAKVATRAKVPFEAPSAGDVDVVERLPGGSGTEFGVPGATAHLEDVRVSAEELGRLVALLRAAWATFDAAARAADGVTLTTGPRGGGRTLAKMKDHVHEAEVAYLGQLGSRPPAVPKDAATAMKVVREAFVATLTARVRGEELPNPRNTKRPWSPRYAVRRSAWHALDHAWELEDRSQRQR